MTDTPKGWRERWAEKADKPPAKKKTKAQQAAEDAAQAIAEQDQQSSPASEHEKSVELPQGDDDGGDTPVQE